MPTKIDDENQEKAYLVKERWKDGTWISNWRRILILTNQQCKIGNPHRLTSEKSLRVLAQRKR
jgi:hypothetical protein